MGKWDNIFHPHTWEDLRKVLWNIVNKHGAGLPHATREDVVQDVLLYLLEKWVRSPKSVVPGDGDKTFRGAVHVATKVVKNKVGKARWQADVERPSGLRPDWT